jgi:hypothetical protein
MGIRPSVFCLISASHGVSNMASNQPTREGCTPLSEDESYVDQLE